MIRRFWTDDLFEGFETMFPLQARTYTWGGEVVDTERYNVIEGKLVPRQSFKDEQIKQIKEKIKALEEEKDKLQKSG